MYREDLEEGQGAVPTPLYIWCGQAHLPKGPIFCLISFEKPGFHTQQPFFLKNLLHSKSPLLYSPLRLTW